jgi:hypothetical protein
MPHLHLQLFDQLRQWITPADQRHLSGFAEIMAAILLSQSACLSRWIPNLSHRDCSARSHLERLSYFVHNPRITASIFYEPLLRNEDLITSKIRWVGVVQHSSIAVDICQSELASPA